MRKSIVLITAACFLISLSVSAKSLEKGGCKTKCETKKAECQKSKAECKAKCEEKSCHKSKCKSR